VYAEGFTVPTGIAFEPGTEKLYVSSRVRNENVGGEGKISVVSSGEISTLFAGLPCCYLGMHGPNGIAFGSDGYGYVGVGGRADHGERLVEPDVGNKDDLQPFEAAILRFSPDGESVAVFARGFRNPYDIAWDGAGHLYATDNGRDPDPETGYTAPDELHQVVPGGEHGYPHYDCSNCFGIPDEISVIDPVLEILPHAAATGLVAYTDESKPAYYNDIFVVTWSAFEGAQNVIRFSPDTQESSVFATGFAQPIDITVGPDGDIFVADYATGLIVRIAFPD
jgi:glucose/arabinose dehydrogenase